MMAPPLCVACCTDGGPDGPGRATVYPAQWALQVLRGGSKDTAPGVAWGRATLRAGGAENKLRKMKRATGRGVMNCA